MKPTIIEHALIETLVEGLPRDPRQLNGLQESDAELIRIPGGSSVLALTTDTLAEELESGLYTDPYQIGWMTVMASVSDLAAVGADTVGILLNLTLAVDASDAFISRLRAGIRDACHAAEIPVLGGDTNTASHPQMGATAVGVIPGDRILTRKGCLPGDLVFSSGFLGSGATFAFHKLMATDGRDEPVFLPRPRIKEGQIIRRHATACIDTSDGALAGLDQLARVNGLGFAVDTAPSRFLDPRALSFARSWGIPEWLTMAGPHGEFELLFTVPGSRSRVFLEDAAGMGWTPLRIGEVSEESGVRMCVEGEVRALDTERIRNLFSHVKGNPARYLVELVRIHRSLVDGSEERSPGSELSGGPRVPVSLPPHREGHHG